MYIVQRHIPQKCSKCNSIDNVEHVTRNLFNKSEMFLRCRSCGHEKLVFTTTSTPTDQTNQQIYNQRIIDEEIF